jgi:hypothetical protein
MKQFRLFLSAAVLMFALSLSAVAGDIHAGIVSSPSPDQQQTVVAGDIHAGVRSTDRISDSEMIALDPMTEIVLGLLQSMLSLF